MNVDYREVNIFPMVSSFNMQLAPLFTGLQADTTEENLQARIRVTVFSQTIYHGFSDIFKRRKAT
jgi:NAD+ synthase (glutamine-hydrolysing)